MSFILFLQRGVNNLSLFFLLLKNKYSDLTSFSDLSWMNFANFDIKEEETGIILYLRLLPFLIKIVSS